ncbi:MAG TPA: M23 family metallopeptidase [Bacteriovoracaceae bacterium]|nr:M23 family metallopeptidase [Bacteriovoracaceae bacterium]
MKYILSFLFIPLVACAQTAAISSQEQVIRPGEVRMIEFPLVDVSAILYCRDQELKYSQQEKIGRAIVVESYFSELKPFKCQLRKGEKVLHEISFKLENREFKQEQLKVHGKTITLNPKDEKRAYDEQMVLNQIYDSSLGEFQFKQGFVQPMTSHVTSVYGIKRVYNKKKQSQHLGIDYRAAVGDKVPASNSGKIVYAGDLFYTGGTVIIDHGLDIFTVYGHLSKTLVKAGEMVTRAQLIGLSGNTGRTSGPHLHWGVKVQGQYIDGFSLIDETKKVFKE